MLSRLFDVQNQKYLIDFDEQVEAIIKYLLPNTKEYCNIQDEIQSDSILIDEEFHN